MAFFQEFTKSGKRKRVSYQQICQWLSELIAFLSAERKDVITRSFVQCGIVPNSTREELHSKLQACLKGEEVEEEEIMEDSELEESGSSDEEWEQVAPEKAAACAALFNDTDSDDELFEGFAPLE